MIQKIDINYSDGQTSLRGFCAFDGEINEKRPLILVAHDWSGRNDFACRKAEKLAELGYIGFALDMYGKGIVVETKEEKAALMQPLMEDRELLKKRILAGYEAAKQIEKVDAKRIGAIGFCFGGLCVLDLARTGVDITGVVSFHGLFNSSPHRGKIKAKILALHGYNDPMVTLEAVSSFQEEMTQARVDWQMDIYSNTMHAFTNPKANDPGFGTVYNPVAEKRSWLAMKNFFNEIFTAAT